MLWLKSRPSPTETCERQRPDVRQNMNLGWRERRASVESGESGKGAGLGYYALPSILKVVAGVSQAGTRRGKRVVFGGLIDCRSDSACMCLVRWPSA